MICHKCSDAPTKCHSVTNMLPMIPLLQGEQTAPVSESMPDLDFGEEEGGAAPLTNGVRGGAAPH